MNGQTVVSTGEATQQKRNTDYTDSIHMSTYWANSFVLKKMYNLCNFCHCILEAIVRHSNYYCPAKAIDKVFAFEIDEPTFE